MTRAVKTGELFATFNFNGKDCADMGIYNITNGSTYVMNIEPTFSDHKLEVPAYDGKYYYGTQITGQQFQFNCFCHDLTTTEYDNMRDWLSPRKIGRLILTDQPYKYYLVKVVSISTLGAYPLTSIQTPDYTLYGKYAPNDVVYTGNFNVTFETVGSAYGYGLCYYRDDLIYDARAVYGTDYYYNTRLIYKDMSPRMTWDIAANAKQQEIPMYNPGSAASSPKYKITHDGTFSKNSLIQFTNITTGASTVVDLSDCQGDLIIDTGSQTITDESGQVFYGRFSGTLLTLNPYTKVVELPETFVENIENTDFIEYDSFYIKDNVVSINPKALIVSDDYLGMYFCTHMNGGSKIIGVDTANNALTLDSSVYTADIPAPTVEDGVLVRPAGFEYRYIDTNEQIPSTGNEGDVCMVDGVMYAYVLPDGKNGEWQVTNYFKSDEDFRNVYGEYIPVYKVFGGTIIDLDDLQISTGTAIGSSVSVDAFTLEAELQPRYL